MARSAQKTEMSSDLEVDSTASSYDQDAAELARLGKKSVLKRTFGLWSLLGFSCTAFVTWEGVLIVFISGLLNGGPAGLVYGFLLSWLGLTAVYSTMAELASMAPTASGQYHWVSILAPAKYQKFLSYITGWMVMCGWIATSASAAYLGGTNIQGLLVISYPDYVFKRWHGTLLFWAVIFVSVFFSTFGRGKILPKIETVVLVVHILGFIAILVPLVVYAPHGSSSTVFTQWLNEGMWPSQGVSFFVGLVGNVFALFGGDSVVHMSEEIVNASVVVPRVVISSIIFNGALGFAMILALLFCAGNITNAIESPTGYPYLEIFQQAINDKAALAVGSIITFMVFTATLALLTTTSRLVWAFARDRGFPGWKLWSQVHGYSAVPLNAVLLSALVCCLLALINIGSAAAFNDVISLAVSAILSSYVLVESLLLWRRCTGAIRTRSEATQSHKSNGEVNLTWGPFHIPGIFGILVNAFAVIYGIILVFFSLWPAATPVTPASMNYSSLMTGSVVLFSIFYYVVWARKTYTGPVIELESVDCSER